MQRVTILKGTDDWTLYGYIGKTVPVIEQRGTHVQVELDPEDPPLHWWIPNECVEPASNKLHLKITRRGDAEQFCAAFGISADFRCKPLGYKYKRLRDTLFVKTAKGDTLVTRYSFA